MSIKEPSPAAVPLSSMAPIRGRVTSPSTPLDDAPTINPPPTKETASKKKKKVSKKKVATQTKPAEQVDHPAPHRARYRYEPYRKADPTPEPEASLPANPEDLETLDATAKRLYKSDREVLEYIEALQHRTAAILEYVNRTSSQLRSCKVSMSRMEFFVGNWQKIGDHWTPQELFGDRNFRAKWENNKMIILDSDESSGEDNAPNPNLFPTLVRRENGTFPTVEEHLFDNINHPDFPYRYARDILGESAPPFPTDYDEEEDFSRPETPPARQPSLPPGHEDENPLEYTEDEIEMRSDLPVPPNHATLASDDSTFNRYGANLRITSDTGVLFPPPEEELARIAEEFKREALNTATTHAIGSPINPSHSRRHPLAQLHVLQSGPQHLVVPRPVPRTPSPPRTVLSRKRKRVSTPEDEEDDDLGDIPGPSTGPGLFGDDAQRQFHAKKNDGFVPAKRRRLITRQPTWDLQMFLEAGYVPPPHSADPPTRENSPDYSSQSEQKEAAPPSVGMSRIQKEDSEIERSQVIEMLGSAVGQGGSWDEREPTGTILAGLEGSQHPLPALTADNTQTTSAANTQSDAVTPAGSQLSMGAIFPVPEDVFGPIVASVKANKISDRLPTEDPQNDQDLVMSDSEQEASQVSFESTRFNLSGKAEKEGGKVFRKTPIRPRTSLRTIEAQNALAAEAEAENLDTLNPLLSPKKKRTTGGRVRKSKATPSVEPESAISSEDSLPSISASKPPSKLRRGRSASAQPDVPALPKTPVRKSTRGRK